MKKLSRRRTLAIDYIAGDTHRLPSVSHTHPSIMRPALRLLQAAKSATPTKHTPRLFAFHPTGIAGLPTHPTPRPTLLTIYNGTLQKLSELPEESAYRTATEAIIKHRKRIVEEQLPVGWEAYLKERERRGIESPPKYNEEIEEQVLHRETIQAYWGEWEGRQEDDHELVELVKWRNDEIKAARIAHWEEVNKRKAPDYEGFKGEPDLSAEQVEVIEEQIGSGLIEQVIEQAYDEYKLVDVMAKTKPWEPLMEEPVEGQWKYFEREQS
ncbi:uncharacterized protein DFL_007771 [Arthrobotrys flagrans]|uniref:Uncharacterized protein n=1 Tax=Arthrobotrys flagrans TaxID=97331 RepID=A0A436ZWM6_ARTFL|nr:hypothetical protein DFL_007771 [Arthrobotrys flagrans]